MYTQERSLFPHPKARGSNKRAVHFCILASNLTLGGTTFWRFLQRSFHGEGEEDSPFATMTSIEGQEGDFATPAGETAVTVLDLGKVGPLSLYVCAAARRTPRLTKRAGL